VTKFHFNYSKRRQQPFFAKNLMEKSQISKSKEGQGPPFDARNAGFFSRSKNLYVTC